MERSSDRKVTTLARWEEGAKRWRPLIKNTIGTLAGVTCPGMTEWCMSPTGAKCYALKIERVYTSARKLLERNTVALEAARTVEDKFQFYNKAVLDYKVDHDKAQKRVPWTIPRVYRNFWDGDIRTKEDARALRIVCIKHPDVKFYQYTRSFQFVQFILGPSNLALYLSVDRYNLESAQLCKEQNPSVKLAFCGDTWKETEELAIHFPGERKGPKCPELTGKIPLVVDRGIGEDGKRYGISACVSCGLCIKGANNVRFASKR